MSSGGSTTARINVETVINDGELDRMQQRLENITRQMRQMGQAAQTAGNEGGESLDQLGNALDSMWETVSEMAPALAGLFTVGGAMQGLQQYKAELEGLNQQQRDYNTRLAETLYLTGQIGSPKQAAATREELRRIDESILGMNYGQVVSTFDTIARQNLGDQQAGLFYTEEILRRAPGMSQQQLEQVGRQLAFQEQAGFTDRAENLDRALNLTMGIAPQYLGTLDDVGEQSRLLGNLSGTGSKEDLRDAYSAIIPAIRALVSANQNTSEVQMVVDAIRDAQTARITDPLGRDTLANPTLAAITNEQGPAAAFRAIMQGQIPAEELSRLFPTGQDQARLTIMRTAYEQAARDIAQPVNALPGFEAIMGANQIRQQAAEDAQAQREQRFATRVAEPFQTRVAETTELLRADYARNFKQDPTLSDRINPFDPDFRGFIRLDPEGKVMEYSSAMYGYASTFLESLAAGVLPGVDGAEDLDVAPQSPRQILESMRPRGGSLAGETARPRPVAPAPTAFEIPTTAPVAVAPAPASNDRGTSLSVSVIVQDGIPVQAEVN